jgi:hypothetical protein
MEVSMKPWVVTFNHWISPKTRYDFPVLKRYNFCAHGVLWLENGTGYLSRPCLLKHVARRYVPILEGWGEYKDQRETEDQQIFFSYREAFSIAGVEGGLTNVNFQRYANLMRERMGL